jgi:hypothetical protein
MPLIKNGGNGLLKGKKYIKTLLIKALSDIKIPFLLSLSIGLAPFFPEPHIWGKLKWIAGGANGMALIDWGDTLFHGFPWLWLIIVLFYKLIVKKS